MPSADGSATLRPRQANARGVRNVLLYHIDEALDALKGTQVSDANIHGARKALKKARATLRLMRDALTKTAYRQENETLRDAARPLSAARDARVLLDALDRVVRLYGEAGAKAVPDAFHQFLEREQGELRRRASGGRSGLHTAPRTALRAARTRIAHWKLGPEGWPEIGAGLKRVYVRGRRGLKAAHAKRTPERLHEWRKQAKYLWHQLQVLEPMNPGVLGELADQVHQLSDYLGDDHDLAVLREKVLAQRQLFQMRAGPEPLLALIGHCQAQLQEKAFRLGTRLYDEKPAAFSGRVGRYWRDWQRA